MRGKSLHVFGYGKGTLGGALQGKCGLGKTNSAGARRSSVRSGERNGCGQAWGEAIQQFDPQRSVFLDESGAARRWPGITAERDESATDGDVFLAYLE